MRHRKRTNGTLHDCIYIRNSHNYVSGCGMRAPGRLDYWKFCPFCGQEIIRAKRSSINWFGTCEYSKDGNKYTAECEPGLNIYDYKNWVYCPFCAKRVIDLSREGDRYDKRI